MSNDNTETSELRGDELSRKLQLHHLEELRASGISEETIKQAGIYTEFERIKLAMLVGYKNWPSTYGEGLVFPYLDQDGARVTVRVKPTNPPRSTPTGRPRKYIGKKGEPNHAYIPPAAWDATNDPDARLFITEGEKKALSATQRGFNCIGVPGVDSWHKKNSFELLPELELIKWKDRLVYVVFDSDADGNKNVIRAERQLCRALQNRGAKVRVVRLPSEEGCKIGLDDFLVKKGSGELEKLIKHAVQPEPLEATETKECVNEMDPGEEARRILKSCQLSGINIVVHWAGSFYRWRKSCYIKLSDLEARAWVLREMDRVWADIETRHVTNVIEHLRSQAMISSETTPPAWLNSPKPHFEVNQCLAMKNEIVHLPSLADKSEVYSVAATPGLFTLSAYDFALDPSFQKPVAWHAFLRSIWENDQQSIDLLQEMFGYLLTADTSQQKIFILIGPKRSGKGTIARVIQELVGASNVAAPTLSSLVGEFGLAPLIGKLVATISDARFSKRADQAVVVERLLSISGEDAQTINIKYKTPVTMKLPTRFVIMSNELPRLNDVSGALASRFIVLQMTNSFYGKEDNKLIGKLLLELPGIMMWAIEGWKRLHDRGYLIQPETGCELASELADLSSPMSRFIRDLCDVGPEYSIAVNEIHNAWVWWCATNAMPTADSIQTFGRSLRACLPDLSDSRPRTEETRVRRYHGIRLKH